MTYTPVIYDWRRSCEPIDTLFSAGGQSIAGGMTLGGASVSNPEPGGRAELVMAFATFPDPAQNLDASWTISRIRNSAIMRLQILSSVQLVPWADLDVADTGQTWANGAAWANDAPWRASPFAPIAVAALAGVETVTVDLSILGDIVQIGHVIGFFVDGYDFAHMVMDVEYDAGEATLTVSPPLRRGLTTDDRMMFRPKMLGVCVNAAEVAGMFQRGRHVQLQPARFVEALV